MFWFALGAVTNTASHFWPNLTQYVPVVERIRVPVAGLPSALWGLTIAHLSDFHASRHVFAESLRRAAQMTLALKPDLIALTGDFVHRRLEYMQGCADALSILRAPLGVHVMLGNHYYWRDVCVVERELRRVGLHSLHHQARRLRYNDAEFFVVGVDDVRFRRADLVAATANVPNETFKLLLVHEPDFAESVPGGFALQLSGHSHGGQIRMCRFGALLLPGMGRKYPIGLKCAPTGMWVYTTRGIGVALPPVRFNCPPEISLLTLDSAPV